MPTTITNQARLQYTYGNTTATTSSNIASTVMQGPLTAAKRVLENAYQAQDGLTYLILLTNTGSNPLTGVTITDNLGAYSLSPSQQVTPLYYTGPAQLFIDGAYSASLTPTPGLYSIVFTIPSLPAGSNAILIYKVQVDDYAPLTLGSEITNTATVAAPSLTEPVTVTATVDVDSYADIRINKTMSPNPVTDGETLTSTFTIHNYGNTAATNVVLSDMFSPAPDSITVSVNGTALSPGDYSYTGGLLTLPAASSSYSLTVPAAAFTRDTATGEVIISPGTVTVVVAGVL